MASTPPSLPPDLFASLPLDLLGHIVSLIRLRPRLLVLALVSRRWRDAVSRTLTSLTPHAPQELLARPSLTRLRVTGDAACYLRGPVSPALLDLELEPSAHSWAGAYPLASSEVDCGCEHLLTVTSLTRLRLTLSQARCCDLSFHLLPNCANLSELVLHARSTVPRSVGIDIPGLAALRLPRLRSLSIRRIAAAADFVAAHATQLTSLAVEQSLLLKLRDLPHCQLAHCADLCLHTADSLNREFQSALLAIAPRLTSLRVLCAVNVPVSRLLVPLLVSLRVGHEARSSVNVSLHLLSRVTELRTSARLAYLRDAAFLSNLRSLAVAHGARQAVHDQEDLMYALSAAAPRLRSLTIWNHISHPQSIAKLSFPSLRRLSLVYTRCPPSMITEIIRNAPALEHLTFTVEPSAELAPHIDLMRIAEQRGVRKLVLGHSHVVDLARSLAAEVAQFRWLVVRFTPLLERTDIADEDA